MTSKSEKKATGRPTWLPDGSQMLPDGSQDPFTKHLPLIFTNFGIPPGIPESTKNTIFSKDEAPMAVFLSIFAAKAAAINFLIDVLLILNRNSKLFSSIFADRLAFVFGHDDLHETL